MIKVKRDVDEVSQELDRGDYVSSGLVPWAFCRLCPFASLLSLRPKAPGSVGMER